MTDDRHWHGHGHGPAWQGTPRHGGPDWAMHARRWRQRGDGEPLRRHPDDRLFGGIAAGLGAWRGFSPTTVRIALAVAALVSDGWAVPFYVLGWLLIPVKGEETTIAQRARHDSRGVVLALALASLLAVFLFLAGALNDAAIAEFRLAAGDQRGGPDAHLAQRARQRAGRDAAPGAAAGEPRGSGAVGPAGHQAALRRGRGAARRGSWRAVQPARRHSAAQAARRVPVRGGRARAAARPLVAADRPRPDGRAAGARAGRGTGRHRGPRARLGAADARAHPAPRRGPAGGRPARPGPGARAAFLAVRGARTWRHRRVLVRRRGPPDPAGRRGEARRARRGGDRRRLPARRAPQRAARGGQGGDRQRGQVVGRRGDLGVRRGRAG